MVRSVLGAVLVGALFFGVLPQVADLSSVWTHIGMMSVVQLSTLGVVAIASLLAYGLVLMAVMPGLTFAQATVVSQSSTAVANTMPAGGALAVGVSYRFYGSWGFSNAAITRNVVVTGIWNIFSKLALPVIALVLLVSTGGGGNGVVAAAIVGVVVLVLFVGLGVLTLSSEHAAHRVGDVVGALVVRVGSWFHRVCPPDGGDVAVQVPTRHDRPAAPAWLAAHGRDRAVAAVDLRGAALQPPRGRRDRRRRWDGSRCSRRTPSPGS